MDGIDDQKLQAVKDVVVYMCKLYDKSEVMNV